MKLICLKQTFKLFPHSSRRFFSSQNGLVKFTVSPDPSLMDEPVLIRASGLPASTPITLGVRLVNPEEKLNFGSVSHYLTDLNGTLDLSKCAQISGKYKGIDQMSPFWSMTPQTTDALDQYLVRDVTHSQKFNLELKLGHVGMDSLFKDENNESSLSLNCTRSYLSTGVTRIPIAHEGIFGTVFLPPESDHERRPLVLTIYGGIHRGTIIEEKAALIASRGFATFAVGFFGIGTLTKRYTEIDIEYFERAINLVCQKYSQQIDASKIGILGFSKGGDLSLSLAATFPELFKACVLLNCSPASIAYKTLYKGETIGDGLGSDISKVKFLDNGMVDISGIMNKIEDHPNAVIPFWKSSADMLWFAGDDDHNFESHEYASKASQMASKNGKTNFEYEIFPGLGHLVDLPYSPPATSSMHPLAPPGAKLYMGGANSIEQHVQAQITIWSKTLQFFKRTLLGA